MLVTKMSLIETMESSKIKDYQKDSSYMLRLEKGLVEYHYSWLTLFQTKTDIWGTGNLFINENKYEIILQYSPFLPFRFDRIYIKNQNIKYNRSIHVYSDLSLCLYHPILDRPLFKIIPLFRIVPWISEWCIHYEEWKKYGVWLGREIKH